MLTRRGLFGRALQAATLAATAAVLPSVVEPSHVEHAERTIADWRPREDYHVIELPRAWGPSKPPSENGGWGVANYTHVRQFEEHLGRVEDCMTCKMRNFRMGPAHEDHVEEMSGLRGVV